MPPTHIPDPQYPHADLTGKVSVEFKALACLTGDHISQVLTYLKVTNLAV